jgi:UDP-glucuronate 4-epimerase
MNVLVTGCAGFIASHVCRQLAERGDHVVGVDSLNDAYDTRIKDWRLRNLSDAGIIEAHRADIGDVDAMGRLFAENSFDAVINLAARAGVPQSLSNPAEYYRSNTLGTLELLELCRNNDVGKFVLSSTSSAYGAGPRPSVETARTDRPLSPYAASKIAAEVMCHSFHHVYDVDVTVLRFFTVYGPAGRPDMSIFRFVRWITEGDPLTLYGDGSQVRDFTNVLDIARGVAAALRPLGYEIINLGSDRPVVLMDAIHTIEEIVGREAVIDQHPAQVTDIPGSWADITKAKILLDWEPEVEFEDGLAACVQWYNENRSWASELTV